MNYGTMSFETSRASNSLEAGEVTFTATNTGNAPDSFTVHGADATGDGFTWTLIDGGGCGTPAQRNKFRHSVNVVGAPSSIFLIPLADYYLAQGVPATTGTVQFTSELYMPCAGSDGSGKAASTTITVVATSP